MKLSVSNMQGQSVGSVEIADDLLVKGRGTQALKETVVALRANQRAGTASTKTKGEVAGSGKKPWKQKGTGQARAGYRQSPIWRGGGVVFGPKPRDYGKRIVKGVARMALRRAFSDRIAAGEVLVVEDFSIAQPKTKDFVSALKGLSVDRKALVVLDKVSPEIRRASRNVTTASVVNSADVNVYQMLNSGKLIISKSALAHLESRMRGDVKESA